MRGYEIDRQARRAEEAERKLEERKWRPIETAPNKIEFRCLLATAIP